MTTQLDQLKAGFHKMSIKQKKQFIDTLRAKLQNANDPQYTEFLNECIREYNATLKSGIENPMSCANNISPNLQNTEYSSAMRKALYRVKVGCIAAFISAGLMFIIWLYLLATGNNLFGGSINIFSIFQIAFILIMTILLATIKSRIAAVIILLNYTIAQIILRIGSHGIGIDILGAFFVSIYILCYVNGIIGAFSYHKLIKPKSNK